MVVQLRKRGKYWSVDYRVGGKRIRKALGTTNKKLANRIKEEIEKELTLNGHDIVEPEKCSLEEFSNRYFDEATRFKRPHTLVNEEVFLRQFREWLGERNLDEIKRGDIEDYQKHLIDLGYKRTTVNDKIKHISAIFGYAVKWGLLRENPCKGVSYLKVEKNPPKFLTVEQTAKVLNVAEKKGKDIYLVFALGIYAGLRKNEIVNLRWEWIDFSGERITLQNYNDFVLKNKESRTIPLNKKLAKILEPYGEAEGYIFNPKKEQPSKYKYRFEFKKSFQNVAAEAGVEWCTPHTLRHTFASQLVMAGVSIYKVSKWLGHSDVRTTTIYSHLAPSDEDINRI